MENIFTFLTGTWFVCFSNFPMWTAGDKINPTFTYQIVQQKDRTLLYDEVRYQKKGKNKSIKGFDKLSTSNHNTLIWRGKGWLKLLSSKWEVALKDNEHGKWAVIYFSKTLFTPEGVDVISREPSLSAEMWEQIKLKMSADPSLAKHLSQIKAIQRSNNGAF